MDQSTSNSKKGTSSLPSSNTKRESQPVKSQNNLIAQHQNPSNIDLVKNTELGDDSSFKQEAQEILQLQNQSMEKDSARNVSSVQLQGDGFKKMQTVNLNKKQKNELQFYKKGAETPQLITSSSGSDDEGGKTRKVAQQVNQDFKKVSNQPKNDFSNTMQDVINQSKGKVQSELKKDDVNPELLEKESEDNQMLSHTTPIKLDIQQNKEENKSIPKNPPQLSAIIEKWDNSSQDHNSPLLRKEQNKKPIIKDESEASEKNSINDHEQPVKNKLQVQKQDTQASQISNNNKDSIKNEVVDLFPPNPLLPKSFHTYDELPRSGGIHKFLKLTRFRGIDHGKSKFKIEQSNIERIDFGEGTSMKKIFTAINPDNDQYQTAFGNLVYLRHTLDFSKKKLSDSKMEKDEVLEENLLDVKKLLKNATVSQQAQGPGQKEKKMMVNMQGVEPFYTKKDAKDKTLIFESRFESGNLAAALKVNNQDYHLLLQNDVNTGGHTQWFFFKVSNTTKNLNVRFNMLNLCKPDSLFNEGMKVLVYSEKNAQFKDIGWHRAGHQIAYYSNGIKKETKKIFQSYYTMTFSYQFQFDDDTIYFAYSYPYTYTDMLEELNKISSDPEKSQFCVRKTLCETLAGNKCELLTITSKKNQENMAKRKGVVITARVHPGESVGSWMMKGALDFLTDENSEEAEILRQHYVFKVIPMLNPDGVINGNYRCSLAGCDLNRRWKTPS